MKRLLIDMDGTVARFYDQAKCIEKMYEPGFFSGLYPYENMVEAVKLLLKRDDLQLYILSTVDGDAARADKKNWITANLSDVIPCMFCGTDRSKADLVQEDHARLRELGEDKPFEFGVCDGGHEAAAHERDDLAVQRREARRGLDRLHGGLRHGR